MSINTVMISNPFILLPDEKIKYESPKLRTFLVLKKQMMNSNDRDERNVQRNIEGVGKVYLTNKRIVAITTEGDFKSLNVLHDQVKSYRLGKSGGDEQNQGGGLGWKQFVPFLFGPSSCELMIFCNGTEAETGLSTNSYYKLSIIFKEGGVFDFMKRFEQIHNDYINNQAHFQQDELPAYSA